MPQTQTQPYNRSVAITPSDTANFDGSTFSANAATKAIAAEAIFCGGAGTVTVCYENGQTGAFTLAVGEILPVKAIRVNSTGTAATLLAALYTV